MTERNFRNIIREESVEKRGFSLDWVGVQCTLVQDRKECIPSEMPKRRNEGKKKERERHTSL